MRRTNTRLHLRALLVPAVVAGLAFGPSVTARSQPADPSSLRRSHRSPVKAAALSLILPGLGHRYVNNGSWKGVATVLALADVAAWVGTGRTVMVRNTHINSYEALAASRAGAVVDGKDRRFFLNLASYRSSDEYLEVQLRNRAWDQIDYVSTREFQWEWETDTDFFDFRDLREDAESLGRRRSILVATLVANRMISAFLALRAAGRSNARALPAVSVAPPPYGAPYPLLTVSVRL